MKKLAFVALASFVLSGCATNVALQKTNLDVETKMSSTVFLEPAAPEDKTVYVQVRNTSDQAAFNIEPNIVEALRTRGYTVTNDPKKANYMLQANILSAGEIDKRTRDQLMADGFGSAATGAVIGTGLGALTSGQTNAMIVGGLAGAAVGTVLNAAFKDVTYSVITDVQVSERTKHAVTSKATSNLAQGNSSRVSTTSTRETDWERYQTRVVSTANKMNLTWDQASPELVKGLSMSLAGMF
jgi:hypothetical protein